MFKMNKANEIIDKFLLVGDKFETVKTVCKF